MTTEGAVAIALVPAAAALAVLALANPKRRRTQGASPISPPLRIMAFVVLLLVVAAVSFAGVAPLLILIAAASSIGWAVAAVLSALDSQRSVVVEAGLRQAERMIRATTQWSASRIERLRSEEQLQPGWHRGIAARLTVISSDRVRAGMLAGIVIAVVVACLAWNAASTATQEARRAALLQGVALLRATTADVQPALTCVNALVTSLNPEQALADLQSGSAVTLSYGTPTDDSGDVSLQRCLLSRGVDTLDAESTGLRTLTRFDIDTGTALTLKTAINTVLDRYEDLAATASLSISPDPMTCNMAARLPNDVRSSLALLSENFRRPELQSIIGRLPHLLSWVGSGAVPLCSAAG